MISRTNFFDVLSKRKSPNELLNMTCPVLPTGEKDVDEPRMMPGQLRADAHVVYGRFLGEHLSESYDYGVFSRCIGSVLWNISWKPSDKQDIPPRADSRWTNLLMTGSLPAPESFICGGCMVMLNACTPREELDLFCKNVVGLLQIGRDDVIEIPMTRVTTVAGGDLTDIVKEGTRGEPTDNVTPLYLAFDPPFYIATMQYFNFKLHSPGPWKVPPDLGGYVFLDGIKLGAVS